MKRFAALAALLIAVAGSALPALARDSYVTDNASLLSASTVSALNAKIGDFYAQTHKEVVVDIESTVTGDPKAFAERYYAQQQINGVLIFVAKDPKTIGVIPDAKAASYFPAGSTAAIRNAIASGFNAGNFDEGVTNGVDLTINMYRSHLGALRTAPVGAPVTATAPVVVRSDTGGGFNMGWIWWLIVLAVIFFIIRGIFRAMSGPRMVPPGYGPGPGYGGGPMMGGGYGPGYGGGPMGGGGGSFFSGLLGGLGGAWLGNELFGGNRETIIQQPMQQAGFVDPGQSGYGGDASGFQSDPGQADMGNSSFGGWGGGDSSGGGGWGGGDSGGGWGGGDSGGGDSGGGGW